MLLTDLARVLRTGGLRVVEVPGWRDRGCGQMSGVRGVLWQHTATDSQAMGDFPALPGLLGRMETPGPWCHLGIGRSGTWYVLAAGRARHAGRGLIPDAGSYGDEWLIGVAAEHPGTDSAPWPPEQLESLQRGTAALLSAYGAELCLGRKEHAPHPENGPAGLDMDAQRRQVAAFLTSARSPVPEGNETMGFHDGFTDWAGNRQTVQSWMNSVDQRLAALHHAFLAPGSQPSPIPGDPSRTNLRDAIMESAAWSNQSLSQIAALQAAVASLGGLGPGVIAEALRPVIAEAAGSVIREVLRDTLGTDDQAEIVTAQIAERLAARMATPDD